MTQTPDTGQRHVHGATADMVLAYVRRALGEEGVAAVLRRSGVAGERLQWTSHDEVVALADAAAAVCGDPAIGRRAGEEHIRSLKGAVDFLTSTGSVGAALEVVVDAAHRMSEGRASKLTEVGDGRATATATYVGVGRPHPFFCDYMAGSMAAVPALFGYAATVTEPACMARGDDACRYVLRWWPDETRTQSDAATAEESRGRLDGFVGRFEQLHTMATELAQAEDVDTVLARITERASVAVRARRHLLAVRPLEDGRVRIHARNFADGAAEGFAERLLAGDLGDDEVYVVADVASPTRSYGRLAAVYPPGSTVLELERRLLAAYARHAAAALEAVASLEGARADRDMAQALLELAEALAEVGTRGDVARRLSVAVPKVAACERCDIWLWDADDDGFRLDAEYPEVLPERSGLGMFLAPADHPWLQRLIDDPEPVIVRLEDAQPPLRGLMEAGRVRRVALVPIRTRGRFFGVVATGWAHVAETEEQRERETAMLPRLTAMARYAATALDNADLLERVRRQALHDTLTGLPNRTLLQDRAEQALQVAQRAGTPTALLFIDLDRFKNVNDTLGHAAGDELIRQAAERLQGCLRTSDTIARIGGDEFVALLPQTAVQAASHVAETLIRALDVPFRLPGGTVFVSCSIGIAAAPRHGSDYSSLLRFADGAMYKAKQAGRNRLAVYAAGAGSGDLRRLQLESELHTAVGNGQLRVLYQPQVDLETLRVAGVEALVRWQHPMLGLLSPGVFLPLAEDAGVLAQIDRWVQRETFRQARVWLDQGLGLRVSMNLSTPMLRDPGLADRLARDLAHFGLDPTQVELEVTERVVIDEEKLPAVLAPLHAMGLRIAIDDLGTGSSALGRLQRCPIDTVKLDRSFVKAISSEHNDAPVVRALIAMSHSLGLEVVGEGAETTAQVAFLRRHGCRYIQGYAFSPPVWPADIERLAAAGPLPIREATAPLLDLSA